MFAFPDVFHFFAHKLAGLSGRRLAFALIFAGAFNYFFFWHNKRITPLATLLDVTKKKQLRPVLETANAAVIPMMGSQLALSCVAQTFDPIMGRFNLGELTRNKLLGRGS